MRTLVVTDDRVGPAMAGSALRAWELARVLAGAGHDVRLAPAPGSAPPAGDGPELVGRPTWGWAEAVVAPPWVLPPRAFLGRAVLVVDGVTPLLAELAAMARSPAVVRRLRTAGARLPLAVARADAILTAGEAQDGWWRERLRRAGRDGVPLLRVPFGIPEADPPAERSAVEGVPDDWAVVLWWGGVWPWLDLETLLAARARIGRAPVSVVVPVAERPGGAASSLGPEALAAAAERHGLEAPQVVPLTRWVPYRERHRILNRTTLLAVLHHPGEEANLSFRTRVLDGVWAGVPVLVSEGGEAARLCREFGWGAVVPAHEPANTAAAMELMLSERQQLRCRGALNDSRPMWRWPRVAGPLVAGLPDLPRAPRGSTLWAAFKALAVLGRRS